MLGRFYSVLQYLSIDIVIGAVILLRFFCVQFRVEIELPIYFLLASAVWLIYTTDHLHDAKKAKNPKRARYLFHEQHDKTLKKVIAIVALLSTVCLFLIPARILLAGLGLTLLSLSYLIIQSWLSKKGLKELYVSIIYTSGILLAPFVLGDRFSWSVFILLFLATFLNLIIFSWFEEPEDRKDQFASIATIWNSQPLESLILILLSLGMALSVLDTNFISVYFLLVFLLYAFLVLKKGSLSKISFYRGIGDGVFLIPILFEFL